MGNADRGVDKDSVFANYQSVYSKTFVISLLCEFLGTMLFAFIGTSVTNPILGPFANGFALACMIYTAANISGGHLNPAVTVSTLLCGFYPVLHSILYMALQVAGAICGSLLVVGLVPGTSIGMGAKGPGCFGKDDLVPGETVGQALGWEIIMTFFLISCVYACGVAKPGHGSFTPLAVGLALLCCACSGAAYSGAFLNPARVLGPAAVFHCSNIMTGVFVVGQMLAAVAACAVFAFVSGFGPLMPYVSHKKLGLSWMEALKMWLLGSPPARLAKSGHENINELLASLGTGDVNDLKDVGTDGRLDSRLRKMESKIEHKHEREARGQV